MTSKAIESAAGWKSWNNELPEVGYWIELDRGGFYNVKSDSWNHLNSLSIKQWRYNAPAGVKGKGALPPNASTDYMKGRNDGYRLAMVETQELLQQAENTIFNLQEKVGELLKEV